jgi:outer membrane protein OmpA-like peptidoglycan-associated protein
MFPLARYHQVYMRAALYPRVLFALASAPLLLGASSDAAAADVGYAVHLGGAAARMVGERKADQFSWGGGGLATAELTVGTRFGVELALGALGLAGGNLHEEGIPDTEDGYGFFAIPGLRVRPFGRNGADDLFSTAGIWFAGGPGLSYTGTLARPALHVHLGYDLYAGRTFRFGPAAGFLQIVETTSDVRPEDARIILFGLHAAFEPRPETPGPPPPPPVDDDRDRDGYKNDVDDCPDDPEDFDRFEDHDGCPDLDNDKDTIPDKKDDCANDPEDFDQFQDDNGCPDLDNDDDGILDKDDDCPNDPETPNGYADDDGCPDEDQVRVVGDTIELDDRVYFRVNMADIQLRSWSLIEHVAKLLVANPQYVLVRVQGHADDTGTDDYNLDLSIRRSEAVRDMLVRFGVDRKRLHVEGFGERDPALQGTSASARRKNRRVEFTILKRAPRPGELQTTPAPPPPSKRPAPDDDPYASTPKPPAALGPPTRTPPTPSPRKDEPYE